MKIKNFIFLSLILSSSPLYAGLIDSGVTVEDLPHFSLNSLGTSTVLSTDIWRHSNETDLFYLIDKIGTTNLTPASRKALILLLTQDSTGYQSNNPDNTQIEFLSKRLQALLRLGAFNEILSLIDRIPNEMQSDEILQIKISILLLTGQILEAEKIIHNTDFGLFTSKANINLFLEKEEKNKSILSYEMYKENPDETDPLFTALGENVLLELEHQIPENISATHEHVFLLSRLKNKNIESFAQTHDVKTILTQLPSTPIETRISLAEKIYLSAEELAKIYKLPLFDIKIDTNALKRAELYQKIKSSADQNEKATLLNELIQSALTDKVILNIAPLLEAELNTIIPTQDNIFLSFPSVQIYGLGKNLEKAYEWYQKLAENSAENHQKERLMLIPILQHLGAELPIETASLFSKFCAHKMDLTCTGFIDRIDPSFDFELNIHRNNPELIVPFEYLKKENASKVGENLINAILDLNNETIQNKTPIIDYIKFSTPETFSKDLIQEGLIYQ